MILKLEVLSFEALKIEINITIKSPNENNELFDESDKVIRGIEPTATCLYLHAVVGKIELKKVRGSSIVIS